MADIKSRLQLDGEQEYKKALNDAYRSLRVLRSELKAETAEMGKNATAQDKASKKADSLKKQIQEQKKIVETLKKALEDSRKEYADNQEVQDKWAEKLNKAREQLANMQNQMRTAQDTLHGFGDSMQDVADSSEDAVQGVVSINDCLKSIGSIAGGVGNSLSNIFTATVETMEAMVSEMYALMGEAWAAAGDWKDIQTMWGGNLEDIEMVMMGAQMQGINPGAITGGIQKLITNIHNGNKETKAAMKELGLSEKDAASHWDLYMKVMQELTGRHDAKRYDLATALFGDKKGSEMVNVIDNWNDMLDKFTTNAKGTGIALSSPEIEALDEVSHKITEIQGMWQMIRLNIGAKLSDILNMDEMSEDVLNILRDLGRILNGDGDANVTISLEEHINSLLETISGAISNLSDYVDQLAGSLQTSTNPTLKAIGDLLATLSDVLSWVSDNSETIVKWLNTLLPMMLGNKVLEATTGEGIGGWMHNLTQLGIGIAQVSLMGKAFGNSAKEAVDAVGLGTAMGTGLLAKIPWLATLGQGAVNVAETVANGFGGVGGTLGPAIDMLLHGTTVGRALIGEGTWGEVVDDLYKWSDGVKENVKTFEDDWNALLQNLTGNRDGIPVIVENEDKGSGINENGKGGGGHHFGGEPEWEEMILEDAFDYTQAQIDAANKYWDAHRSGEDDTSEWMEMRDAFGDNIDAFEALMDELDGLNPNVQDIPETMYNLISGALTQGNDKPIELNTANNITIDVYLDGNLIQQQVSQRMANSLMRLVGV